MSKSPLTTLIMHAATCDEQDAWSDENVSNFGWLLPTADVTRNVRTYREMNRGNLSSTVGYVFH